MQLSVLIFSSASCFCSYCSSTASYCCYYQLLDRDAYGFTGSGEFCYTPFFSLIFLIVLHILQLISVDYSSTVVTKLQILSSSMWPPRDIYKQGNRRTSACMVAPCCVQTPKEWAEVLRLRAVHELW